MRKNRSWYWVIALFFCFIFAQSSTIVIASENYPQRNVNVIIPYGAGGGTDTQARIFLNIIETILGKPFIVINKPGAKGEIGNTEIYKSKPDGYQLGVLSYPDNIALETYKQVDYKSDSYRYIGSYTQSPVVFIVQKESKFATLKKLVAFAKENPGKITVSVAGDAHVLPLLMLEEQAGIKLTPVFYKSGSAALNGLLGNHVDAAMIATQFGVVANSQGCPTIAVAGDERVAKLPNSPTFIEEGFDIKVMQSRVFVAPPGTPDDVVEILTKACDQSSADQELKAKLENLGEVYKYFSGDSLEKYIKDTNEKVKAVVNANKDKFVKK